jgi:energy-coupling factor transport system substrate-specific component
VSHPRGLGLRPGIVVGAVSAVGVAAFLWPFVLQPAASSAGMAHSGDAPWLVLAIMPVLIVVVVGETTSGRLDAKGLAMMGVLATMGTALRIPGGPAGIEPIFFVFLPAARVFGRAFGFVLGAITLFASALLTAGVGPWLPFQMLAAGWFAYGAGCLPPMRGRAEVWMLALYGAVGALAYGLVMDLWFWPFGTEGASGITFVPGDEVATNLGRFLAFHVTTALGWDMIRAATTVAITLILARPALASLRRAHRLAAFDATPAFGQASTFDLRVERSAATEGGEGDVGPVGDDPVDAPRRELTDPLGLVDRPHVDQQADVVAPLDERGVHEPVPGVERGMTAGDRGLDRVDRLGRGVDEVARRDRRVLGAAGVDRGQIERRDEGLGVAGADHRDGLRRE